MKCPKCGSEDFTDWELEDASLGRTLHSCMCRSCLFVIYVPGLFMAEPNMPVVPKRDFYADREAMNQEDIEILHNLGIKA